jgi:GH15 family glucan-1,4-alpha-glucosidase
LGASWHPYVHDGIIAPPIQEDETALVVFVLAQFYSEHKDMRLLRDFYASMVKPMCDWMASFVDETTGLPRPSYDLWEEKFLTSTFTTATVYAALQAASDLADIMEDKESAVSWRAVADDILAGAQKYLYNVDRSCFYKGIIVRDGNIEHDATIDASSIYGAFMFGLFPVDSSELKASVDTFHKVFPTAKKGIVAFPRYENDQYHRVDPDSQGNWWFITTLWMAQYSLQINEPELANAVLTWIREISSQTSIMAEQISPVNHELISPSPLSWSHAEYLSTLLDTIK